MYGYRQPQRNTGEIFRQIFFSKNVLSRLILINTVIYLLVQIVNLFAWLFAMRQEGEILSLIGRVLALPASLPVLASKPWTLFTYMFLQEGFFHLLFNLIMLYFGGIIFLEYLNGKKLLWTYILGGLAGAFFFVAAYNIFPVFENVRSVAVALGASASVLAIIIAIATYVPDYTIHLFLLGRMKMKYLALIFVAIDLLSITKGNAGGHIAHLGGALWGFVYAFYLRKGNDFYKLFYNIHFTNPFTKRKWEKMDTTRPKTGRPMDDDEYSKRKIATQKEIDHILDKISKSGYDSLTKAEKDLLFKNSSKE
ncbi:MAG: rhomboid family intramembrane serine protease [Chlorobi bacterium]|nr:rhomboid family intramembrane serine protease [Chlorobiota bacterium]